MVATSYLITVALLLVATLSPVVSADQDEQATWDSWSRDKMEPVFMREKAEDVAKKTKDHAEYYAMKTKNAAGDAKDMAGDAAMNAKDHAEYYAMKIKNMAGDAMDMAGDAAKNSKDQAEYYAMKTKDMAGDAATKTKDTVSDFASGAALKASEKAGDAKDAVMSGAGEARQNLKKAGDAMGGYGSHAANTAEKSYEGAKQNLGEAYDNAKDSMSGSARANYAAAKVKTSEAAGEFGAKMEEL